LGGDPSQHFQGIVLLLLEVFPEQETFRIAGAAHVHADARIPMRSHIRVVERVSRSRVVSFAVRQILENGRDWVAGGVNRSPYFGRENDSVREGNRNMLDDVYRDWT
jgi:hypothetical protein